METPRRLPSVILSVGARHVHLGELLKLNRSRIWLEEAEINTVLDVGANTGQFASAIRAILPDAFIYSFEPLPDCCAQLEKRLARYGNFKAFPVALGNKSGTVQFWRSSFSESSSILPMSDLHKTAFPWTAENTPVELEINRLDDYLDVLELKPNVLLKLDVQGYEKNVLEGGQKILEKVNYVIAESSVKTLYEGESSFDDVYQYLLEKDFRYAGNIDQLILPIDQSILQVDSLFIR